MEPTHWVFLVSVPMIAMIVLIVALLTRATGTRSFSVKLSAFGVSLAVETDPKARKRNHDKEENDGQNH